MWIYIIPAGIGALLSVVYYKDRPPVPPTQSGDHKQERFFKGIKDVSKIRMSHCLIWKCRSQASVRICLPMV